MLKETSHRFINKYYNLELDNDNIADAIAIALSYIFKPDKGTTYKGESDIPRIQFNNFDVFLSMEK